PPQLPLPGKEALRRFDGATLAIAEVGSKQVRLECKGHLQSIISLGVTPDGRTLLTGLRQVFLKFDEGACPPFSHCTYLNRAHRSGACRGTNAAGEVVPPSNPSPA